MRRVVAKEGALEAGMGGWWKLQQRHGWLKKDNEVIPRAWKCVLLWRISILGVAFEQESEAKKRGGKGGTGDGSQDI